MEKCQIIDAPLDSDEDKAGVPESRAPLAVVNILKLSNTVAAPKKVFKANASILAEAQSRPSSSSSSTLPASKILQHRLIAFSNLETEPPAITVKHPDKVKVVSDQKTTKTISIKTVAPPEANSTVVEQAPPMKPSFVPPSTTMFASSSSTSSSLTLMRTRKESVPKINCYSLLSTDEEDSDEHSDPRSIGKSCELDQNTADNWGYWPTEPSSLEQEGDKPYSAVKEEVDSEEEVEIKVSKTSSSSSKMPTTVHHHGKITMPLIASSSLHSITTGDGIAPRHKESPLVARSTISLPSSFSVQKDDHVYEGAAKIIHSSTLPTINYNQSIDWRNMPTHIKPSATVVDLLSWADDDDDEDEEDNEHDDSDVETAHHTSHPKIDSSRFAASNNGVFQRSAPLRVSEIIDLSF